jgi:hypothetical protein
MPNQYLFPKGMNLVILQLPDDDITNNVQILCPTNHYAKSFYESTKPTLILMKKDDYYEPIYSYTSKENAFSIKKLFSDKPPSPFIMRSVINEIIKPFMKSVCKPLESMKNVYHAKPAIYLYELIDKLIYYRYTILKLVLNFNNKVIGVLAKDPNSTTLTGFIPCYPSGLSENMKQEFDYVFMTDLSLWNDYNNTISFLKNLYNRNKNRDIPCKPVFNVIEDKHVVGILTETNQFVQLSKPIREIDIDINQKLPTINNNYLIENENGSKIQSDVIISTSNEVDVERVEYIRKIQLETNFYNIFRNTIRILINDYENLIIRESLEKELKKDYIIYSEKLKNLN